MRFAGALILAVALLAVTASAADPTAHHPLHVEQASLTQDGQYLVWQVKLGHPFSAAGLHDRRRSLCLQLETVKRRRLFAVICLWTGRRGKQMRLVRMKVSGRGRGPAHTVEASLSRGSSQSLTARFLPDAAGLGYREVRWQVLNTLKPPACHPKTPTALGCVSLYPGQPALARFHVPRLVGCEPSGPAYVTHGTGRGREVALTFDDGPWPDTPQFLDILEREHVPATFFQIGEQVSTYGGSVDRRMLKDGDMIGDHTWSHANVSGGGSFAASQITSTASAIRRVTGGFRPCLFRAPGGAVSGALIGEARSLGFTTIEWDIDPRDWARPGTGAIYSNVVSNAHAGAIVIQHDGGGDRSETLAALPHEIHTLRSKGYRFVTVTDLLGQRLIYK
jgi:peptidoglycan-N-acetylglucosamine deacetylase